MTPFINFKLLYGPSGILIKDQSSREEGKLFQRSESGGDRPGRSGWASQSGRDASSSRGDRVIFRL